MLRRIRIKESEARSLQALFDPRVRPTGFLYAAPQATDQFQ